MVKVGIGIGVGVVWLIVLLGAESGQYGHDGAGGSPVLVIAIAGAVSLGAVVAAGHDRRIAAGASGALAAALALGFLEGPMYETPPSSVLFSVPALFSAALGSTLIWVALGVAVGLTVTPRGARGRSAPAVPPAPAHTAQS